MYGRPEQIIPFIVAFSNSFLRGGLIEVLFPDKNNPGTFKNIPGMRYVHAVIYGLCAFWVTHHYVFGIVMAVSMAIGQVFAIDHDETLKDNFVPMLIRGIVWAICLATGIIICGYDPIMCLLPALFMFPVYRISDEYYRGHKSTIWFNQVTVAEMVYGWMLGLVLLFVIN